MTALFDQEVATLQRMAKEMGLTTAEFYLEKHQSLSIQAFNQEIETFSQSTTMGLGVRVLKDGGQGYAYTEQLSDLGLEMALNEAIANAALVPAPEGAEIRSFPESLPMDLYNAGIGEVPVEDKIARAKAIELAAKAVDERIEQVPYAYYQDGSGWVRIANTMGLDRTHRSNIAMIACEAIAVGGGLHKEHYDVKASRQFTDLKPEVLAAKVAGEALHKLGAKDIVSGHYPIVFDRDAFCSLLNTFWGIFSAKAAQEGKSRLKDKIGETIASPVVTLIDDPLEARAYRSRPFDDEGCPSKALSVIDKGVFTGFFHNVQTANRAKTETTGHGTRSGFKGVVGVAPSNLILQPGDLDLAGLLATPDKAVYITGVTGLHAGTNGISGDFSLQAEGYYYEKGVEQYPVHLFTVSGNFYDLLKGITHVGSDLVFEPGGAAVTPSVLVESLAIAGAGVVAE
ncbi:MAG: TldD/PmbA family protein [Candidatus Sericytochromatia bacterium]|nr:TldD/PmbA family protein [Candidatus Sericytochromatia bacterium]